MLNLERFGRVIEENFNVDPNDILLIPENDHEIEAACEVIIEDYILKK